MTSVLEGWGVNNLIQSPPASPSPQDVTQPQFRVGDAAHEGNEESNSTKQLEHSRVWGGDNAVSRPSDAAAGPQSAASPHFCHPHTELAHRTRPSVCHQGLQAWKSLGKYFSDYSFTPVSLLLVLN